MPKSVPIALPRLQPIYQDLTSCRAEFSALSPEEQSVICGLVQQTENNLNDMVEAIESYGKNLVFQQKALKKQLEDAQAAATLQAATGEVDPSLQSTIDTLRANLLAKNKELAALQAKLENYKKLPGVMGQYNAYFQRLINAIKAAQAPQPVESTSQAPEAPSQAAPEAPSQAAPEAPSQAAPEAPSQAAPEAPSQAAPPPTVLEQISDLQRKVAAKKEQMKSGDQFVNQRLEREITQLQARIRGLLAQQKPSVPIVDRGLKRMYNYAF
jgi:chromosome segregation ATPase